MHGLGDEVADFVIAVGGNSADLGDLFVRRDLLRIFLQLLDDGVNRLIDAALEVHRVHAGSNRLGAFLDDCVRPARWRWWCRHRRYRRSWTRPHAPLRAHVLELVRELDFLGDRHTILGDARGAEGLIEHDVAAFRAERDLHRVGQNVDAAQHAVAGIDRKFDVFSSHCSNSSGLVSDRQRLGGLVLGGGAALDHAHDVAFLHDKEILAVDLDLGARPFAEQHDVAELEIDRDQLAVLVAGTRADGDDLALRGFSLAVSGMMMPPAVFSSLEALTTTRS